MWCEDTLMTFIPSKERAFLPVIVFWLYIDQGSIRQVKGMWAYFLCSLRLDGIIQGFSQPTWPELVACVKPVQHSLF